MNSKIESIFHLLECEEYFKALKLCCELIDEYQARFAKELTVNTATDYVGAVILYAKISSALKKPWMAFPFCKLPKVLCVF